MAKTMSTIYEDIGERMKSNGETLLLAILGSIGIFFLRYQASSNPAMLYIDYSFLSFVIVGAILWRHCQSLGKSARLRWLNSSSGYGWLVGAVVILFPLLFSILQSSVFGVIAEPNEIVWIAMLQNAAIWQSAMARSPKQEWTAFLLSCFLLLFGVTTSDRATMLWIIVPFGLLAAWWLMSRYWRSIERGFVAVESVPLVRLRLGLVLGLCITTLAIGVVAFVNRESLRSLDGFMPTSGGNSQSDPSARSGIGDGDMLVAAKDDAYTFGPVDSDLFLESNAPSMYDLASETFGEPKPRQQKFSRAVALNAEVKEREKEASESKKAGKEFSAIRQPKPQQSKPTMPEGNKSSAVLHVIGQVPLHLRMESFDHFDGQVWSQSDRVNQVAPLPHAKLSSIGGKPWMQMKEYPKSLVHSVAERVTTKLINLTTTRIASPALLSHVHIDRIDREDFFEWSPDGQLSMPGRDVIPQLTVTHLLYQIPNLHSLRHDRDQALTFPSIETSDQDYTQPLVQPYLQPYLQLPFDAGYKQSLVKRAMELIAQTSSIPADQLSDWSKVVAIVQALRRVQIDRTAVPEASADDVVAFALDQNAAPEYLLATTAVSLLRSLDIPCRFVSGFYASPKRYNYRAEMTEVMQEDLHVWAEVYVQGTWLPVEPSQGYAHPREHRTWSQFAVEYAWLSWQIAWSNPVHSALALMFIVGLVIARCRVLDAGFSSLIMLMSFGSAPRSIRLSLIVLRFRLWVWRTAKPDRATINEWLERQLQCDPSLSMTERGLFIQSVHRLAYAPKRSKEAWLGTNAEAVQRVCVKIVRRGVWDACKWRGIGSQWAHD
jgi:protein-glutamine gamma-glutamyltransferase